MDGCTSGWVDFAFQFGLQRLSFDPGIPHTVPLADDDDAISWGEGELAEAGAIAEEEEPEEVEEREYDARLIANIASRVFSTSK